MTKLKEAFLEYNSRYFRNSIPRNTKVVWGEEDPNCIGYARRTHEEPVELKIWISPRCQMGVIKNLLTRVTRGTLLHEMAHLKLWKKYPKENHGNIFNKEMKRLAKVGAFRNLW